MSDLHHPEKKTISRRTVTKAMAWSVPAVAVAASVPVVSASPPVVSVDPTADTCKATGAGKGCCGVANYYQVAVSITNNGTVDNLVTIEPNAASVYMDACQETTQGPVNQIQVTVGPGDTETVIICAGPGNCNPQSSGSVDFTYTYEGANGSETLPGSATFLVSPPCGDCAV